MEQSFSQNPTWLKYKTVSRLPNILATLLSNQELCVAETEKYIWGEKNLNDPSLLT